jgi:hypothetical protein
MNHQMEASDPLPREVHLELAIGERGVHGEGPLDEVAQPCARRSTGPSQGKETGKEKDPVGFAHRVLIPDSNSFGNRSSRTKKHYVLLSAGSGRA